jgi:hypothetical protein
MDVLFKSIGSPIFQSHCNEAEGCVSLREGASEHLFQMELSQTGPQIVRNKTPEDHQGYN